jgi:hypothetical protein
MVQTYKIAPLANQALGIESAKTRIGTPARGLSQTAWGDIELAPDFYNSECRAD